MLGKHKVDIAQNVCGEKPTTGSTRKLRINEPMYGKNSFCKSFAATMAFPGTSQDSSYQLAEANVPSFSPLAQQGEELSDRLPYRSASKLLLDGGRVTRPGI